MKRFINAFWTIFNIMNISHITDSQFPIDERFRGNEVLIDYYLTNSRHNNVVFPKEGHFSSLNEGLECNKGCIEKNRDAAFYYDAVILHDFDKQMLKKLFEQGYKKAIFLYLHCLRELYPLNPQKEEHSQNVKLVKELLQKRNLHFIAVSEAVKSSFQEVFSTADYTTICGCADQTLYLPKKKRPEYVNAKKIVGYSGRCDNIKGTGNLLEVMKLFEENSITDVGFLLALSGSHQRRNLFVDTLNQTCPKMIRENRVKIVLDLAKKKVSPEERKKLEHELYINAIGQDVFDQEIFYGYTYFPIQRQIDCYFHPANSEAFGLSVLEAIMSGVPVVTSNVGGLKEYVNKKNGVLVDIDEETREKYRQRDSFISTEKSKDYFKALTSTLDNLPAYSSLDVSQTVSDKTPKVFSEKLDCLIEKYK